MDNLRIGKNDVTEEEAIKACEVANIAEFINYLPQKLDTIVRS